jgi:DNA polymerase-3 subunit alpha
VFADGDDQAARDAKAAPYRERLSYELGIIESMGFAGYFLIVADFIRWAKRQGIPVGPGRGSGAGSVVAWALTITDLDPLKLGLLFERFLNPERVSMPDFDIDFCETRREEVIRYVAERYGREQVAQIITFGKLKARAVLKDVGRVLQMPYGQVDRLAKLVPNHPTDPWTLERALNGVSEIAAEVKRDANVERLFELARKLEGLPRHSSTHAAGVVIGDRPLSELVPLHRDPRSDMPVTQFDMKWVERAGLVKFDFLGLKTLSVLQRGVELLAARGIEVDLAALTLDDPDVYALLARGDTVGVFQFESEGMRRALGLVKPDCFEDIIALGALYRPGPMDNIPSFANRKHGVEQPDYLHPWLADVLRETYGVIIYQEQVMQIAQILAGYTLGEADLLRRAMGKKKKEEMDAQKARFLAGAAGKGVDAATADRIFELVAKFAGYGFNKSHAAAYALVAYQTAWLKAKYPVEFYAASMAFDITLTDKLQVFVEDMRRMGVQCLPPCINGSQADFAVEALEDGSHAVRYALAACKGVGAKAMEALVAARASGGRFTSLADFCQRVDPRQVNRRLIESLASAGAFDCIDDNRARVFGMAGAMMAAAQAAQESRSTAQVSLFGEAVHAPTLELLTVRDAPRWTLAEAMARENAALGHFLSSHPLDCWKHVIEGVDCREYREVSRLAPTVSGRLSCTMAGLIEETRWRTSAAGRRYLMVALSDASGQYLASCFDEAAQTAVEEAAKTSDPVLIQAELNWRPGEDTPRVTVRGVTLLPEIARRTRCRLTVAVETPKAIGALASLLADKRGGRGLAEVRCVLPQGRFADIVLGSNYALDANLVAALERTPGIASARLAPA